MSHKKTAFRATHVVVVYIREVCGINDAMHLLTQTTCMHIDCPR